jgi:hypothetical protein
MGKTWKVLAKTAGEKVQSWRPNAPQIGYRYFLHQHDLNILITLVHTIRQLLTLGGVCFDDLDTLVI